MARPDKYAIVDAVRYLVRLLREADGPVLDEAYQYVANDANNSEYATDLEPLQSICAAFTAETKRRGFEYDKRGWRGEDHVPGCEDGRVSCPACAASPHSHKTE